MTGLRHSSPADTEEIAELHGRVHGEDHPGGWAPGPAQWVRDLMAPEHPRCGPEGFVVATHVAPLG